MCKSGAEIYVHRHTWEVPSRHAFLQKHPRTGAPWWQEILAVVGASVCDSDSAAPVFDSDSAGVPGSVHNRRAAVSDGDSFDVYSHRVQQAWPTYLRLLSWWQLRRFFRRSGNSIVCKPRADVVVVHPVGRFTTAKSAEQAIGRCWRTAIMELRARRLSLMPSIWTACTRMRWSSSCTTSLWHLQRTPIIWS